jgi:hypothetical protein
MATLGPPLHDYRLPSDTFGFRPPGEYSSEDKKRMLRLAAFMIFGWEPLVEGPSADGQYQVYYRYPHPEGDGWLSLGVVDQAILDEDHWGRVNARLREFRRNTICERWPEHWKCYRRFEERRR